MKADSERKGIVMDKKWKMGYKVCRRQGNRFVSYCMGRLATEWYNIYGVGHVTRRRRGYIQDVKKRLRKFGPLGVFIHESSARNFMERTHQDGDVHDPALFKCRFIESKDERFWLPGYRQRKFGMVYVPDQRFADAVELIEEVS